MAAVTPVSATTTGAVDKTRGLWGASAITTSQVITTTGSKLEHGRTNLITELYYFTGVNDADTWASGITGIKACFTMGDDADGDKVTCAWSAAGTITFDSENASADFWLLLFIDPSVGGRSGLKPI